MFGKQFIRCFSSNSPLGRAGYSSVEPVHHLVKINKAALKPKYQFHLLPKDDIESVGYKPTEICQDRVQEYYENVVKPNLMLNFYEHGAKTIEGNKKRSWGVDSPYKLYRGLRKQKGLGRQTRDIHPIKSSNIPEISGVTINAYNKAALEEDWINISNRLQIAQITNVKPKVTYSKSNVIQWKVRKGKVCGCKVELTGRDMTQFLSTLTELVLPRMKNFEGLMNTSGDSTGNVSFGLTPDDVKFFPEIENFQELYPNLFGFNVTIKTTARTDEQAKTLISAFGFPFTDKVRNISSY